MLEAEPSNTDIVYNAMKSLSHTSLQRQFAAALALCAMLMLSSAFAVACDEGDLGGSETESGECLHHESEGSDPHRSHNGAQHSCVVHLCTCVYLASPVGSTAISLAEPSSTPQFPVVKNCSEFGLSFCIDHPPKS